MLICQDLSVQAGSFQLQPITLRFESGQFHVILGPTGSGKTLLLEALVGLRKVQGGQIWRGKRDITHLPPERRHLAYLPQDGALFPHMSVAENIFFGLPGGARAAQETQVQELIDWLGLRSLLDRRPAGLSGGEKQRVALLRAIASGADTLLLDEPTAALHQTMSDEVSLMLRKLQRKLHLTVVMVSHDLRNAYLLADQLTVLMEGRLQQTGAPDEVFRQPSSLALAHFLGMSNLFPAHLSATSGGELQLHCAALGGPYVWPSQVAAAEGAGWLGVHRDAVQVGREQGSDAWIQVTGIVDEVLDRGDRVQIMVRLMQAAQVMTMDLLPMTWHALKAHSGDQIWMALDPMQVFWISRDGA